ncbi:hypothetical protein L207DRAFT_572614 [Hyaloscypha variabilis F]|uniref:Uncharacterized protein n=1 Tax=Hyaloscypha variabilis (strain UAMH 11265 / GT02V1 / F) TaxID=1149755 RepID=A0A2J6R023_HYAVF|nr:hypothetical protein L207DRAFT_572614 [Hyaloscypha variabilis F]
MVNATKQQQEEMALRDREQANGLERRQPGQHDTTGPDNGGSAEHSVPAIAISGPFLTDKTPSATAPIDAASGIPPKPQIASPVNQNERQWRRAIMRQQRARIVKEEVVREVITIWDLESGITAQRPGTFEKVARLLEIDGISSREDCDKEAITAYMVEYTLEQVLRSYNYCDFTWTSINGKGRLEMRPIPEQNSCELPKWLQIPFLVPLDVQQLEIIPEKGYVGPYARRSGSPTYLILRRILMPRDPAPIPVSRFDLNSTRSKVLIGSGDKLFLPYLLDGSILIQDAEKYAGTLGVVMKASSTTKTHHVVLTAGHVIDDMNDRMFIISPCNGAILKLEVPKSYQRCNGRPARRTKAGEPCTYEDECGFLKIDDKELEQFHYAIPNWSCHYFNPTRFRADHALDPLIHPRWVYIRAKILEKGQRGEKLVVYKHGAATGDTQGYLVKIRSCPPTGWFGLDNEKQQEWLKYKDDEVCLGIVQWMDADTPFTGAGDSGSLVYAQEDKKLIPLGIHLGAPESMQGHSVFLSIDTFCYEAEREGWELTFALPLRVAV